MRVTFSGRRRMWSALVAAVVCLFAAPGAAEAAPKLSVNDTVTDEPASAADPAEEATFTIKLSRKAKRTARVDYATTDYTAQSDGDYTHTAGTAAIKKGKKKKTVVVPINGDELDEDPETFSFNLSNPRRATINDDTGVGTIIDTDVSPPVNHLVINEVDYDQPSTDTTSFIEVYNPTDAAVSLANLAVVGITGGGNTEYLRVALAPAGASLASGGYLVIRNNTVTVAGGALTIDQAGDWVQNGGPDGVALIDTSALTVIDALSYEGSITAAQIVGFPDTTDLTEGGTATAAADHGDSLASMIRSPNGADTDEPNADWALTSTPTAGAANTITP